MLRKAPRAATGRIPPERRHIANRIKRHRLELGWSRATLARELGVTAVTISQWEAGKTAIRRKRVRSLAEALGVATADLTGSTTERRERVTPFWKKMIEHFKECPNGHAHVHHMAHAVAETQHPEDEPELGERMAADIRELARKLLIFASIALIV